MPYTGSSMAHRATRLAAPLMLVVAALGAVSATWFLDDANSHTRAALAAGELHAELFHLQSARSAGPAGAADVGEIVAEITDLVPEVLPSAGDAAAADLKAQIALLVDGTAPADAAAITDVVSEQMHDLSHRAEADADRANTRARTGVIGSLLLTFGTLAVLLRADRRRRAVVLSERLRDELAQRREALIGDSPDLIWIVDTDRTITFASPAALAATGDGVTSLDQLLAPFPSADRDAALHIIERGGTHEPTLVPFDHEEMGRTWLEIRFSDQRDNSMVRGTIITARDVTDRVTLEHRLAEQARSDHLTDLANRRALTETVERTVARATRRGVPMALVLVDLDGFKGINDTLGHPVGDALLRQVAARLRGASRQGETVGRLGGDEFAVVLDEIADPEDAVTAARRFLDALQTPYEVDDQLLVIGASLGVAHSEADSTVDQLFRRADIALYEAKQHGRNRVVLFENELEELVHTAARLQREMGVAMGRDEFSVVYQPLLSLASRETVAFEALMRWHSPTLGTVSPLTFIPVAERSGMIVPLGRWILEEACRQLVEWTAEYPGAASVKMSVNVSVVQLLHDTFHDDVVAILERTGMDAHRLQIEVTESILVHDTHKVVRALDRLRTLGVSVALDDFGTGYSSMGQLQTLPVDCIKIDRSFIEAMRVDEVRATTVVKTLAELGRVLGMLVVAEGVENQQQLDALRLPECDQAQGYYFAQPMPPGEVLAYLRAGSPAPAGDASR